eukprot:scaffold20186_cov71-Cyclotella_meneghiniana.AAC.1
MLTNCDTCCVFAGGVTDNCFSLVHQPLTFPSSVITSRFGLGGPGAPPLIPPSRPPPYLPCFHRAGNSAPR